LNDLKSRIKKPFYYAIPSNLPKEQQQANTIIHLKDTNLPALIVDYLIL
jgi:hypothetical protein